MKLTMKIEVFNEEGGLVSGANLEIHPGVEKPAAIRRARDVAERVVEAVFSRYPVAAGDDEWPRVLPDGRIIGTGG